ncbi:MAG: hypothetical protein K0R68_867 [Mycobacterium sp.]|nr:hypothetical protein [Mycobacterium sp.]
MANDLLDFVMGLVRDPDAAARYAADPGQAIADAHLTDVTSADVNNLIPMVSDSLSMAAPSLGSDGLDTVVDSNVWTSGAATAAFDAFAPLAPVDLSVQAPVIDTAAVVAAEPVSQFESSVEPLLDDQSDLLSAVSSDALDADQPAPWHHQDTDPQPLDQGHAAFDLFD